jgi:hypothetical protein
MKGPMYNEEEVAAEFRELAAFADKQFRELTLDASVAARVDADETLARSCVYGNLYDRYFLETPELLLNELRWLQRTGRPRAPSHAHDAARFDQAKARLLDELIARFAREAPG